MYKECVQRAEAVSRIFFFFLFRQRTLMCIHKGLFIMTEKKKQQSFLSQPSPSMLSHFLTPPTRQCGFGYKPRWLLKICEQETLAMCTEAFYLYRLLGTAASIRTTFGIVSLSLTPCFFRFLFPQARVYDFVPFTREAPCARG